MSDIYADLYRDVPEIVQERLDQLRDTQVLYLFYDYFLQKPLVWITCFENSVIWNERVGEGSHVQTTNTGITV